MQDLDTVFGVYPYIALKGVCVCVYYDIYICKCMNIFRHIYIYMYVCIYIYIYRHVNMYIGICIYSCV